MNQTMTPKNPHFAIDFGRVREVVVGRREPFALVRRGARRQIPLRILLSSDGGDGETLRPPDALCRSECTKFVWILPCMVLFAVELHRRSIFSLEIQFSKGFL